MALTPMNTTEEVFVREVDEELQRDQLLSLWQRYGKPAVWGIVAVLLAWAGYLYWGHRQNLAYGLEGETVAQAVESLEKGGYPAAEGRLLAVMKSDAKGFHGPTGLILGGMALEKDDAKKAATKFAEVAGNADAAQTWRDLALIRQTAAEFDTLKPDVIISRMKPLTEAGKPWFGSAGEMTAMAYLRMKKPAEAGKIFASLAKDEKVPETIRNRSSEQANALGIESSRPAAKEGK